MAKATGKVKFFDDQRGFGFIERENDSDVFVHYSAIEGEPGEYRTLHDGQPVEFEVVQGRKGPQAESVRKLT